MAEGGEADALVRVRPHVACHFSVDGHLDDVFAGHDGEATQTCKWYNLAPDTEGGDMGKRQPLEVDVILSGALREHAGDARGDVLAFDEGSRDIETGFRLPPSASVDDVAGLRPHTKARRPRREVEAPAEQVEVIVLQLVHDASPSLRGDVGRALRINASRA